jgi:hypothetical protein
MARDDRGTRRYGRFIVASLEVDESLVQFPIRSYLANLPVIVLIGDGEGRAIEREALLNLRVVRCGMY